MSGKQGEWCMVGVCLWGIAWGNEPLILMICYSCEMPQSYEALEGWKPICDQPHNLEHKGENFFFSYLLALLDLLFTQFHGMMHADPTPQWWKLVEV